MSATLSLLQQGLPDPAHRGVIDPAYVRGKDVREFPKWAYKANAKDPKGYSTLMVNSQAEQDTLKGWVTAPKDIHALLEGVAKAAEEKEENEEAPVKK